MFTAAIVSNGDRFAPDVFVSVLQSIDRNDVDRSPEERFEGHFEIHQVEQGTPWFELDQEIEVARCVVVATGCRAEQGHTPAVMTSDEFVDLIPPRFHDRTGEHP